MAAREGAKYTSGAAGRSGPSRPGFLKLGDGGWRGIWGRSWTGRNPALYGARLERRGEAVGGGFGRDGGSGDVDWGVRADLGKAVFLGVLRGFEEIAGGAGRAVVGASQDVQADERHGRVDRRAHCIRRDNMPISA